MQASMIRASRPFLLLSLSCLLIAGPAVVPARSAEPARAWDFDGDGRRDMAVGIPGEDGGAGAIEVFDGSASGPDASTRLRLSPANLPGTAEADDFFGAALASGDFDADGYADLAIGVPREDDGDDANSDEGKVIVAYGSSNGLATAGAHALVRATPELGQPVHAEAFFGYDLAAADFDADGYHDLAVATETGAGGVIVYRGGTDGLDDGPSQQIGPNFGLGIEGFYASDMATGDLDGNGITDLAIGYQEHDQARGAVIVLYGKATTSRGVGGLSTVGTRVPRPQVWTQDSPGVKGIAADRDAFGSAVGIGDVNGDGRKDLVVTALREPIGEGACDDGAACGAVHVLKGARAGVSAEGDLFAEFDDVWDTPSGHLGAEVAVGDLNANGIADIAVTAGNMASHMWGSVLLLSGTRTGLGDGAIKRWTQASNEVPGDVADVDYWGEVLEIRDAGWSRTSDLLVSDPREAGGIVSVMRGNAERLIWASNSVGLTQETAEDEADDAFGLTF